ncbi:YeeE/YedE family protein [Celerinatantimonas sp. YJH-8]|uniref:YeeE/YedE family protein n=1 Tax=Celerinatantimonas sp. YJH-8 TaxID=3228714 RepID=UPI0038C61B98
MPESWLMGLLGGMVIGAACLLMLSVNGKIAGISGIVGQLLQSGASKEYWRAAFLVGLIMSPWLAQGLHLHLPDFTHMNIYMALVAGLLVGIGTRLGNGCTSGHGICGVGRFSKRSIVATITFVVVGMITATLVH